MRDQTPTLAGYIEISRRTQLCEVYLYAGQARRAAAIEGDLYVAGAPLGVRVRHALGHSVSEEAMAAIRPPGDATWNLLAPFAKIEREQRRLVAAGR